MKDRILVGHAVYNDLKVCGMCIMHTGYISYDRARMQALLLSHPSPQLRDTQSLAYKYRAVKSRRPALRVLVKQELGIVIQGGEHNSVSHLFSLHSVVVRLTSVERKGDGCTCYDGTFPIIQKAVGKRFQIIPYPRSTAIAKQG